MSAYYYSLGMLIRRDTPRTGYSQWQLDEIAERIANEENQ